MSSVARDVALGLMVEAGAKTLALVLVVRRRGSGGGRRLGAGPRLLQASVSRRSAGRTGYAGFVRILFRVLRCLEKSRNEELLGTTMLVCCGLSVLVPR